MKCFNQNCKADKNLYQCIPHKIPCCNNHISEHALTQGVHKFEKIIDKFEENKKYLQKQLKKKFQIGLDIINKLNEEKAKIQEIFEKAIKDVGKYLEGIKEILMEIKGSYTTSNNEVSQLLQKTEKELNEFIDIYKSPSLGLFPNYPENLLVADTLKSTNSSIDPEQIYPTLSPNQEEFVSS